MQNNEQQIVFLKTSVNGSACHLCVTDRRFIVIGKKSGLFSNSDTKNLFIFGFMGAAIGNVVEKHARENNANFNDGALPGIKVIDDLLDYDKKHNFDITYDSLYWAVLNSGSSNMTMLSKKSWYQFKFNRDQIDNLSKILPTLTGLCEKFKINK